MGIFEEGPKSIGKRILEDRECSLKLHQENNCLLYMQPVWKKTHAAHEVNQINSLEHGVICSSAGSVHHNNIHSIANVTFTVPNQYFKEKEGALPSRLSWDQCIWIQPHIDCIQIDRRRRNSPLDSPVSPLYRRMDSISLQNMTRRVVTEMAFSILRLSHTMSVFA